MRPNKWLLRYVMVVLAAGLMLALAAHTWRSDPAPPAFPDDADVVAISASLAGHEGFGKPVPEFVIPAPFVPRVLRAFRPVQLSAYPAAWEEETLGRLVFTTQSGRTYVVRFCFSGKNPLCYNLDGVRCIRGGKYVPAWVGADEHDNMWAAECASLANALGAIYQAGITGQATGRIEECFQELERSAGERPAVVN
jgi:hypothetical protein